MKRKTHPVVVLKEWVNEPDHSVELLAHYCNTNANYMRKIMRDRRVGINVAKRIERVVGIPWVDWFVD